MFSFLTINTHYRLILPDAPLDDCIVFKYPIASMTIANMKNIYTNKWASVYYIDYSILLKTSM